MDNENIEQEVTGTIDKVNDEAGEVKTEVKENAEYVKDAVDQADKVTDEAKTDANIANDSSKAKDEDEEGEKKKRSPLSIAIELAIYVVLILASIFWFPEYVMQRTVVSGESMETTLQNHDSLLVNKFIYRFKNPDRYDIVIFYPYGKDVDEYYVKRVYGLPGETVQIKENDIYINGNKIEDKYASNAMDEAGIAEEPIKLGEDEFFVLGDNRMVSMDSRDIGPVKKKNLAGEVMLRVWPLKKFGIPK